MPVIRKAVPADAQAIYNLLIPYAEKGIVLRRSLAEIEINIPTFYVADDKNDICGVIAYFSYGEHLKEIRSLAVRQEAKKKGTGRKLIEHIMRDLLKESPSAKIFTLTVIPEFFLKFGFHEVDKNTFPEKIWKDCTYCAKQDTCDETALVYGSKD